MALEIRSQNSEQGVVELAVAGEVDVSCADELRSALDEALESGALQVVVDIAELSYIDSTGIGVLVGAVHRAQEQATELRVARPQRNVRRVLGMLGMLADLGIDD